MPERIDFPALLAGHTVVIEMINSGDAGLPVLTQLLRVAQPALGATGMAFVEFGPTGGRVIAATGAAEWALGRPLAVDDPDTVCLLSGPRVRQVRVGDLNGKLAGELAGSGLRRMVGLPGRDRRSHRRQPARALPGRRRARAPSSRG